MEISFLLRLLQQSGQTPHPEAIRGGLLWSLAMLRASDSPDSGLPSSVSADTAASMVEGLITPDCVPGLGAGAVHFWFSSGPLCTGVCSVSSSEPILVLALFASLSAKLWVLLVSPSSEEMGLSLFNPSKQSTNVPAEKGKVQTHKNYREF